MASCSFIHAGQGGRGEGSQVLAAVTRSPGEMVVGDVTGPGRARAGHVIVRPERVGICGSGDMGALSGSRDFYPRIQGREVSAIGEDPGDSETSAGGLAERLEVPAGLVFGAGDLDPDSACFVEPASVAVHALARGRLQAGEQVVVFGAGPIGL